MTRRRQFMAAGSATAIAALLPFDPVRSQQEWPNKPVTVVVPYAPGGSSDVLGRLIAAKLSETFKQSFVIENQGGASGAIGSQRVARAAPDGYTLLVADVGSHIVAPLMFGANSFDPMKDFTHVAFLGGPPFVLAVHASSPIRNLKDFIAYVRAQPNGSSWASSGLGSRGHLLGEVFKAENKLDMVHIAYKGAGPAVTDVLGNQVPAAFVTLPSIGSSLKSGKLRGIGMTSAQRVAGYPDIPTFAEQGFPTLTSLASFMLSGPANLPPAIVDRLNAAVRKAVNSPDIQARYLNEGLVSLDMTPDELKQFLISEKNFFEPIIKSLALTK